MSFWNDERRARVVELVAAGRSGSEIAADLGTSRSAVLGHCYRCGITLPMTEEKRLRGKAGPRKPRGPQKPRPPYAARRGRQRGQRNYPDDKIAAAIAARLAGASYPKAAALIGASPQALNRCWMKNDRLVSQGRELYERAKAEAAALARVRREAEEHASRRVAADNRMVITAIRRFDPRLAEICDLYLGGATIRAIAPVFGVSHERIAQLLAKAKELGVNFGGKIRRKVARCDRGWRASDDAAGRRARALSLEATVQAAYA